MGTRLVKVARVDQLKESRGTLVRVGIDDIALFKRDGTVYALNNVCSHQHFSKLHEGEIVNLSVICPMHGWTYDMQSGMATNGGGRVRTYPVHIQGNDVVLEVEGEEE
jgi:nitrite reductase/ring-hydroxylating ferredoxin subunit